MADDIETQKREQAIEKIILRLFVLSREYRHYLE